MSTIWLDGNCRLVGYGASVKGPKSRVKIEVECLDGSSLGFLLDGLRQIEEAQRAAAAVERPAPRKTKRLPKPAEPLALPYFRSDP
jgi:hypothetical protein